jgi:hypothetical protein
MFGFTSRSNYFEFFQPLPKKTAPAKKISSPVVSTKEASDALNGMVVEAAASVNGSIYDRETEVLDDGSTTCQQRLCCPAIDAMAPVHHRERVSPLGCVSAGHPRVGSLFKSKFKLI